jgi:hypothetical protein
MPTVKRAPNARQSMAAAFTDPALPVGRMIPVIAATIPADIRRSVTRNFDAQRAVARPGTAHLAGRSWSEVFGPLDTQGGCRFGCKLYARRQGAVIAYAVHHSLTYGHSHSPNVR